MKLPGRNVNSKSLASLRGRSGLIVNGKNNGSILVIAIVFLFFVLAISTVIFTNVASFIRSTTGAFLQEQSVTISDAGIDYAIWKLNTVPGWNGTAGTSEPTVKVGNSGEFTITITPKGANKQIVSTGFIPQFAGFTTKITSKVEVKQQGAGTSFPYAILGGAGGTIFSSCVGGPLGPCAGAQYVKISGNVFSNSPIETDLDTGQALSCRVAGPGIANSYCQVLSASTWSTGLIKPSPADKLWTDGSEFENYTPPETFPDIDEAFWEAEAAKGGTTDCGNREIDEDTGEVTISNGPYTIFNQTNYPLGPHLFVYCNLGFNNSSVTINGPVYVKEGSISFAGASNTIKLNDNFLSQSTIIIAEKQCQPYSDTSDPSQTRFLGTSSDPRGYIMLYCMSTARNRLGFADGSQMVIYVPFGTALVGGSATPFNITGAVIGNEVRALAGLNLTYDPNLESDFSLVSSPGGIGQPGSGGGGWQVVRGTYKFSK